MHAYRPLVDVSWGWGGGSAQPVVSNNISAITTVSITTKAILGKPRGPFISEHMYVWSIG